MCSAFFGLFLHAFHMGWIFSLRIKKPFLNYGHTVLELWFRIFLSWVFDSNLAGQRPRGESKGQGRGWRMVPGTTPPATDSVRTPFCHFFSRGPYGQKLTFKNVNLGNNQRNPLTKMGVRKMGIFSCPSSQHQ